MSQRLSSLVAALTLSDPQTSKTNVYQRQCWNDCNTATFIYQASDAKNAISEPTPISLAVTWAAVNEDLVVTSSSVTVRSNNRLHLGPGRHRITRHRCAPEGIGFHHGRRPDTEPDRDYSFGVWTGGYGADRGPLWGND